jgi:hypothetical protein
MYNSGDVILIKMQFVDTREIKKRPALILFQEHDNIVVAGITSNKLMKGIKLTKQEGAIKDSIIKLNYIFTTSKLLIEKKLFTLTKLKKEEVKQEIIKKLKQLN